MILLTKVSDRAGKHFITLTEDIWSDISLPPVCNNHDFLINAHDLGELCFCQLLSRTCAR